MFEREYAMKGTWPKHFDKKYYKANKVAVCFISAVVSGIYAGCGWTANNWVSLHIAASAPAIFGKLSTQVNIQGE